MRLLRLFRRVQREDPALRRRGGGRRQRRFSDLLLLRRHDAFERRVAQLIDAALNRQHRGQRHLDPLKPAALELAFHAKLSSAAHLDFHDDGGVTPIEPFGEDHACLGKALVVGLQAGENQVELLVLHGGGERACDHERVGTPEPFVLDMNRTIGATCQRLTQDLRDA